MKRVLSLVLVVVMLLCFGACDKKNDDNNGTPTEAAGNTYTGCFYQRRSGNSYH